MSGTDIRGVEVDNWTGCWKECRAEPTCIAITYINEQVGHLEFRNFQFINNNQFHTGLLNKSSPSQ